MLRAAAHRHELLNSLPPLTRWLFAGLWTIADRDGRLEDRPRRIKIEVLAYDDCDCDSMLQELAVAGFIVRYSDAEGRKLICIPSWLEHQHPHPKEPKSTLSPPNDSTLPAMVGPRQFPERIRVDRAGSSMSSMSSVPSERSTVGASAAPEDPVEQLQGYWNEKAPAVGLPAWRETGKPRRTQARARLRERAMAGDDGWRDVIDKICASNFCRGQNDRKWVASPDWLLQPETATKVLEGKYDNRGAGVGLDKGRVHAEDQDHTKTGVLNW